VLLVAILLFELVRVSKVVGWTPAGWLGAATLSLAYVSVPTRLLFQTEVSHLQGGGISQLPLLSYSRRAKAISTAKALVLLCLVAFLV